MADTDNVLETAAERQRSALVKVIRSKPEVTLADLSALLEGRLGPILGTITISDLMGARSSSRFGAAAGASNNPSSRQSGSISGRGAGRPSYSAPEPSYDDEDDATPAAIESRTAAGRAKYDEALLEATRKVPQETVLRRCVRGPGE